jgi:hypothetical protein
MPYSKRSMSPTANNLTGGEKCNRSEAKKIIKINNKKQKEDKLTKSLPTTFRGRLSSSQTQHLFENGVRTRASPMHYSLHTLPQKMSIEARPGIKM